MPDLSALDRFKKANRIVERKPITNLRERVARAFDRHLVALTPQSIKGPYHDMYAQLWQKMVNRERLSDDEATKAANLITILYHNLEQEAKEYGIRLHR